MTDQSGPPETRQPCPECGRPNDARHYPFCSARCKGRDLNRWLSDGYVIPGPPAGPADLPDND